MKGNFQVRFLEEEGWATALLYSAQWMMAIHIPVPFVFLLRVFSGLNWTVIPFLVLSDIAGQMVGGKLKKREADKLT